MDTQDKQNSISEKILAKAREGQIKMKPRAYFIFKTALFVLGILVLLLSIIYIASFAIFSLRASGAWFLPRFGFLGIRNLFGALPWLLILLSAVLIVMLELFAEKFSFIYKKPMMYSLAGIILIVIIASFILSNTPLHTKLFDRAKEGRLPLIGALYSKYGIPKSQNIHHGFVLEVQENAVVMENLRGEKLKIIFDNASIGDDISIGDAVVVIGQRNASVVSATAIIKIDKDDFFLLKRGLTKPPLR